MNRQGKMCDAVEERMQSAHKAFWTDILIHKDKDVPWKIKCQRLVDHVYAVFTFGRTGHGHAADGKDQRMGNQNNDAIVPFQKTRKVGRVPYKNVYYGQENMVEDGPALFT